MEETISARHPTNLALAKLGLKFAARVKDSDPPVSIGGKLRTPQEMRDIFRRGAAGFCLISEHTPAEETLGAIHDPQAVEEICARLAQL